MKFRQSLTYNGLSCDVFTLQWCESDRQPGEIILWILIFSQASDMQYDALSFCWVAQQATAHGSHTIIRVNKWYSTNTVLLSYDVW
jgi:hypothetical protein